MPATVRCPRCGGLKSPTTEHACRVQLHPQLTAELRERRTIPVWDADRGDWADPVLRELEALWALDADAPLDAYLDRRS